MQTIGQYAEQAASGDQGRWRSATRYAARLVGHHQPTIDLTRRLPLAQITLQTAALILYGLAGTDGLDPSDVAPIALSRWVAERDVPHPPCTEGSMSTDEWLEADQAWRRDLDRAVNRIRRDLAELLRHAGHPVPDADVRSLARYSDDPVVMTWIDLADTDPPDSPARLGGPDQFLLPRIALGVAGLNDLDDWDGGDEIDSAL